MKKSKKLIFIMLILIAMAIIGSIAIIHIAEENIIKKAKEVCFNNIQIIVKNTYDTTDKILIWVIAVFTGIGVYAITDIIMKRKFS